MGSSVENNLDPRRPSRISSIRDNCLFPVTDIILGLRKSTQIRKVLSFFGTKMTEDEIKHWAITSCKIDHSLTAFRYGC